MEQWLNSLLSDQDSPVVIRNNWERDGNPAQRLFIIDQASISVTGGTTLYSPTKVLSDLLSTPDGQSRLTLALLPVLIVIGFVLLRGKK